MGRFSVVVAGGGVAAIEALLRLRRLAGDRVDLTLLAPNADFAIRALSVREPFAQSGAARYAIRQVADDAGARWVRDRLERVDCDRRVVVTGGGEEIGYDALLVAVGGRVAPAFEHVTTFRDEHADELFGQVVDDIEDGYAKSVAFIAPVGPVWLLPLYELALLTAARARDVGMEDVDLHVVTPDSQPLVAFGPNVGAAVGQRLDEAGVTVHASAIARVPSSTTVVVQPEGVELHPDRMVALPRITGPDVHGLPTGGTDGFIPVDSHCAVSGCEGVFAAGDATAFPVKHGGVSAQQADTAAAAIAQLAGADVEAAPCRPVIRGLLLTGRKPLYLVARPAADEEGFESEVSEKPLWPPGEKVVAEDLGEYLGYGAAPTS